MFRIILLVVFSHFVIITFQQIIAGGVTGEGERGEGANECLNDLCGH